MVTSINTIQNIYSPIKNRSNDIASGIYETVLKNVYSPSEASSSSESSSISTNELDNKDFYSKMAARAAISSEHIAKQKEKFADMYVTSAAHKYFYDNQSKVASSMGLLNLCIENAKAASREDCMSIPISAGELPQLMDRIQNSLRNGNSLEDILKQKYDEHIAKYGEEGHTNSFADWFSINTSTGEVMSADPISRTYHGDSLDEQIADVEAVMELADDLATFLRYVAFSQETDDSEKVDELISFIKNKQAYADYDRFLADSGDETANNVIVERLIAAGVLKDEDEEKEKAIDGLMEVIRIHQEELRENKIDKEESKRIIFEIQELIDQD